MGTVICRMLGYTAAKSHHHSSSFGVVGTGSVMPIDNLNCLGTETNLADCSYVTRDNCGTTEFAGVMCTDSQIVSWGSSNQHRLTLSRGHYGSVEVLMAGSVDGRVSVMMVLAW